MGASAERIALQVTSTADVRALQQAGQTVTATANAAKAANDAVAASAAQAANAEKQTTSATTALTVSQKQMSDALARNGGDLQKAAAELAKLTTAAKAKGAEDDAAIQRIGKLEAAAYREDAAREKTFQREMQRRAALEAAAIREDALRTAAAAKPPPSGPAFPQGFGTGTGAGITGIPPAVVKANSEVDKLNPKLRTTANALGVLSQAAVTGQGSVAGLATAAGSLADGLANVTKNAKLAATASGIGALITVAGIAYGLFSSVTEKTKDMNREIANAAAESRGLQKALNRDDLGRQLEQINRQTDAEIEKLKDVGFVTRVLGLQESERLKLIDELNRKRELSIRLATKERDTRLDDFERQKANELRLAEIDNNRERTQADIETHRIATEAGEREHAIYMLFAEKDLSAEQEKRRKFLLDQSAAITDADLEALRQRTNNEVRQLDITRRAQSVHLVERVEAEVDAINDQRDADIKATGDRENAVRVAEQRKRQLYRETAQRANADAKTLFDVLRSSNDAALKSIGTFGENVRRVIIGAEAARAAVRAAIEGGEAIASLASGDFRGAALHGAAALELAKAAAIGAQEALGGGRTASGGGGGGGGNTFEPRQQGGGAGGQVVNLYTVDPYSGEAIRATQYHLDRSGVLKRPIYVPPTTGFAGAA